MATAHSLSSLPCQTIITSRPSGRSAPLILANAVPGSSKNIVPNLLIASSNCCAGKRCTCASACSKVTLRSPRRQPVRGHVRSQARRRRRRARCRVRNQCGLAGCQPGATADVEDVVVNPDTDGPA